MSSQTRPNIVFIMIDDLGWADLGCYGSSFYETPQLDALAQRGMRFTDAYASCPVCSPTRASLLSGKYPARVGMTQFVAGHGSGRLLDVPYFHELPDHEISLASVLRDSSYQTWHVGKWHLGDKRVYPDRHGFDINIAGCGWGAPREGYFAPWGIETLPEAATGTYLTDHLTDEAIRLITKRDHDKPYFLHLAHYAVHTPLQAPQKLINKYLTKAKQLGLDDTTSTEVGDWLSATRHRGKRVKRRTAQSNAVYAAMIENLDTNIGRLLEALDDNTLVVFTSDNGGLSTSPGVVATSNAPLREGKGWMEDGGVRVSQIVSWPEKVRAGSICSEPMTTPDWYPTLCHIAGTEVPQTQVIDGVDISPLLFENGKEKGDEQPFQRGPLFWHYPHYSGQGGCPGAAVRWGDWKLIEHFETGKKELFNLREDIAESNDYWHSENLIGQRLWHALKSWQHEVEAIIPKPNPNWQPFELPAGVDPAEV